MADKGRLDIDAARSISEFQSVLKEFKLKKDIYRILFRGKGLEFEGFRNYTPDDDASDIDWKTSARSTSPVVKVYKEERDLNIMFIVDVGSSMVSGSQKKLKCEYAAEVIAALSHLIMSSGDRVGFFIFGSDIRQWKSYGRGDNQLYLFMDILANSKNYGGQSDLNMALDYALQHLSNSTSSVILVSDFLSVNDDTQRKLTLLASRFETMSLIVRDPLDFTLPDVEGEIVLQDSGSENQLIVNPKLAKGDYERFAQEQRDFVLKTLSNSNVDFLELDTSSQFYIPLATFLKERRQYKK